MKSLRNAPTRGDVPDQGLGPERIEPLIQAYQDRLVRYAFRRLRNIHDAEDAVQGVFVRVFRDWTPDGRIQKVGAYLYRAVANACADVLRERKRSGLSENSADLQGVPADRPDAPDLAAAADDLRRIEVLLERLPERQAEVVRLRVLDELRFAEIAEVLGCRLATVKSRFRYGLEKLRRFVIQRSEVQR